MIHKPVIVFVLMEFAFLLIYCKREPPKHLTSGTETV